MAAVVQRAHGGRLSPIGTLSIPKRSHEYRGYARANKKSAVYFSAFYGSPDVQNTGFRAFPALSALLIQDHLVSPAATVTSGVVGCLSSPTNSDVAGRFDLLGRFLFLGHFPIRNKCPPNDYPVPCLFGSLSLMSFAKEMQERTTIIEAPCISLSSSLGSTSGRFLAKI